jgi:hypothetical protein
MGKARRGHRNKERPNPTGKSVKPPTDPELAAIREKQVLPIIADLTSPEAKKRSSAAIAIANLIEDGRVRKLLLREQIVRILLEQTITDSDLESKSAGWGILKNLALEEDASFCIHLYRQDILTAIQAIAQNILTTLESVDQPYSKLPKAQQELLWTLTSSILGLTGSLAEAQEDILESITNTQVIINLLHRLIGYDHVPDEVLFETLTCMASLTEENEKLAQQIVDHESWLKELSRYRELGGPHAVAACSALHNIFSTLQWFDHNTPNPDMSDAIIVTTLMEYLDNAVSTPQVPNGSGANPDQIVQLALEITASIATSLQEALEHANRNEKAFEGFDDAIEDLDGLDDAMEEDDNSDADEEGDDDDDADEEKELDDDEMEADMDLVTGPDTGVDEDSLDEGQPTLHVLIRVAVPTLLSIILKQDIDDSMRNGALSALNNIAWTTSSIDFTSSRSKLAHEWAELAQCTWSDVVSPVLASNTADVELAASVTSLAWAIARSMHGRIKLQKDEQKKFMALYHASANMPSATNGQENGDSNKPSAQSSDAFQGLGVKCIGVLGQLALDPAPLDLNREIGVFLITVLSSLPSVPPADAVEALNQLMDIYADKEFACDSVFWGDNFHQHLDQIAPKAKKMAKSVDKRKHEELRLRADEAVLNLGRFLAYKKKEKNAPKAR